MIKTLFHIFLISFLFASCGTPQKAIEDFQYEIASTDKIEGRYYNGIAIAENETSFKISSYAFTLWGMLNWLDGRILGPETYNQYSDDAIVELKYYEPYLYASIYENGSFKDELRIKTEISGDYVTAYKFKLIPIPIVFYVHQERCLLLTKTVEGNELVVNCSATEIGMFLLVMAGGVKTYGTYTFTSAE